MGVRYVAVATAAIPQCVNYSNAFVTNSIRYFVQVVQEGSELT